MLKRVDKITKVAPGFSNYPEKIRRELITRFGCDGTKGNFFIESECSEDIIKKIRDLISSEDGMYRVYKMWYSEPIKSWRLVFGYE
jgi:hypothetical protein